ncbi:STAS domain-containing protein [Labedaea rhizosphaerae]|uniref:Anti-anti-sigma factor n=1 Tax=Labedaea rhizosphaerae TaxID=598644 RepID=A0A4R6SH87_LABRH|nr:STAS domain-containing protein [Labedaea rhizosphaerae]TDQ00716.1 anti-anti-sigma factor [Labedaea rhizosphaerae]
MTDHRSLTCTWHSPHTEAGRLRLDGELDYGSGDVLLSAVGQWLSATAEVRELRIDCAELRFCDSWGLSVLLTVHRLVTSRGARLSLDNRNDALDRLLTRTNTLDHLTGRI